MSKLAPHISALRPAYCAEPIRRSEQPQPSSSLPAAIRLSGYAWLSLTRDGKRVVRVYLSDNRTELPRTHEHVDACNSRRFDIRQPSLRGPVVLRDEEAVGSNPATPTIWSSVSGLCFSCFPIGNAG
jgi:hypothetical protein